MLVTRPEPGAAETARQLAALGWDPVLAPALRLVARPVALARAQALLLTSRAAARALPPDRAAGAGGRRGDRGGGPAVTVA